MAKDESSSTAAVHIDGETYRQSWLHRRIPATRPPEPRLPGVVIRIARVCLLRIGIVIPNERAVPARPGTGHRSAGNGPEHGGLKPSAPFEGHFIRQGYTGAMFRIREIGNRGNSARAGTSTDRVERLPLQPTGPVSKMNRVPTAMFFDKISLGFGHFASPNSSAGFYRFQGRSPCRLVAPGHFTPRSAYP